MSTPVAPVQASGGNRRAPIVATAVILDLVVEQGSSGAYLVNASTPSATQGKSTSTTFQREGQAGR